MIQSTRHSVLKLLSAFVMMIVMAGALPGAVAQDDDEEERRSSQPSLSQSVALGVQEALNLQESEQLDAAIARLNKLISDRGDRFTAYDRSIVFQIRGQMKAQKEDYPGALRDLQSAVDAGGLPVERANELRYVIAQLHFQLENYDAAIRGLRDWLRIAGDTAPANAYYLLAVAYYQKEDYRASQQPMERALELKNAEGGEPDKGYYSILNGIYSQNNENGKRAALLERMINIWPEEAGYWEQLTGAYAVNGDDEEAFSVLEVAYRAGLITKEAQIIQLIQYYSFFDNAFRGAKLLEREMNAGVVRRTQDNLVLLSQLWGQAREAKKSIPILREAAQNSSDGKLNYRLGQVLVADEKFSEAEKELRAAIRKGGLSSKQTGDAYLLLGNALFLQAGPEDRPGLRRAREAFQSATRYPTSRRVANGWVVYINNVIDVLDRQDEAERLAREELCNGALERLEDARRINQLQGRALNDVTPALAADLKECGYNNDGTPINGETESQETESDDEGEGEE